MHQAGHSRPRNVLLARCHPTVRTKLVSAPLLTAILQDAHEFLNYLLNECSELLEKEQKQQVKVLGKSTLAGEAAPSTWVHELFQVLSLLKMFCVLATSYIAACAALVLGIVQEGRLQLWSEALRPYVPAHPTTYVLSACVRAGQAGQ